jgi:hypothetical protein
MTDLSRIGFSFDPYVGNRGRLKRVLLRRCADPNGPSWAAGTVILLPEGRRPTAGAL